jgi:Fe2+ transport system protein B
MECCEVTPRIICGERFDLTIALAGNANVGKSVIFNALIVMLYVPCVSTIAALRREFGNRRAALVSAGEVTLALVLGALVNWGWNLVSLIR